MPVDATVLRRVYLNKHCRLRMGMMHIPNSEALMGRNVRN